MISGLLTVKPANTPKPGDVRCYTVENLVAQSGNAWTKVKGSTPDNGGQSYKVLSVKPTGRTDKYGNISLNVEIEPANGTPSSMAGRSTPPPQQQQQRTNGAMSKEDYWARKEERDIAGIHRMGRAHSQEMAIRYFGQRGGLKGGEEGRRDLLIMIDWFERDLGRMPSEASKPEPPPEPEQAPEEDPF